ncbi:MAG: hypothetical protein KDC09_06375 [Bacteroidales bacterium]|nr:hypothetical protein [Bacteroidales bacterium]
MVESYNSRTIYYSALSQKISSKSKNLSILRLVLFIIAAFGVYLSAVYASISLVVLVLSVSILSFAMLVQYHSKVLYELQLLKAYTQINENEEKAEKGNYSNFKDGEIFQDPEHPFAFDIDLFGKGSLFQFLARTVTNIGTEQLAKRLKNPILIKDRIIERQRFINFLASQLEWRQKFQATGTAHEEGENDRERIMNWIKLPGLFQNMLYLYLVILIPVVTTLFTALLSIKMITFQNYLLYLIIPWGIAGTLIKKTNTRHSLVSKTSDMLVKYSKLLKIIDELKSKENLKFPKDLQAINSVEAGKKLKELSAILNALDNRLNPISWTLLNAIFLWDILQMIRLEKWQKKNQKELAEWFYLIAETDALISLANFNFNMKDSTVPEFSISDEMILAKALGHPLIAGSTRVHNDVEILKGSFVLITGANMAGKSTYLRTIATSMVLAMNGCSVPAQSYQFSPIQLYTSIRTQDSLQKNESYFYAELKRLKSIIDVLRDGNELFIILDEILKGTNSKDKHQGSEALLKQLISLKSSGIVATHDIMLGELESIFPDNIRNFCFEVDITDERLDFDYKLRRGVSQNMNATILMRQMGITV